MPAVMLQEVPFGNPMGEVDVPSSRRPIDLIHLARQSSGDRGLEGEILSLFRHQLKVAIVQLGMTSGRERRIVAHTIKGSARAVGAFGVARLAERIEHETGKASLIDDISEEADRVIEFIAALNR